MNLVDVHAEFERNLEYIIKQRSVALTLRSGFQPFATISIFRGIVMAVAGDIPGFHTCGE